MKKLKQAVSFKETSMKWKKLRVHVYLLVLFCMICGRTDTVHAKAQKVSTFQQYYNRILVPKYGKFKTKQEGTVTPKIVNSFTRGTEWLKASGVISASVQDFDMDGKKEMLACIARRAKNKTDSYIVLAMYEKEKGGIRRASKIYFRPYCTGSTKQQRNTEDMKLWAGEIRSLSFILSSVKAGRKNYFICEAEQSMAAFANGGLQDYWILEYKDQRLQYVQSYTQTGAASDAPSFESYVLKDGKLKKKELICSYFGDGKYSDFGESLDAFFQRCGIKLKKNRAMFGTILSKKNKPVKIFAFKNKAIGHNSTGTRYKFVATMDAQNHF